MRQRIVIGCQRVQDSGVHPINHEGLLLPAPTAVSPVSESATSLGSWARAIKTVLDQRGLDGAALCRQVGIDPASTNAETRLPLTATKRLWQLAVQVTGDEALGLHVASAVRPSTFLVLELSMNASSSIAEMFQRIVRFFRIVTDAAEMSFGRQGDEYHLCSDVSSQVVQPAYESTDAFMSLFIRMCRARLGRDFCPRHLYLCRPAPANVDAFTRVLRTPITFGSAQNLLVLDRDSCERQLDDGNAQLAQQGDDIIRQYLARTQGAPAVARSVALDVETVLIEMLPLGEPDQQAVARQLGLSTRSLQRRLAAEGHTWKQLLEATRHKLALHYLCSTTHSIVDIACLLGYSDSANFTRACRRWEGKTPSAIRREK
jgi:AraC-like DNA-binding protein